MNKKFVQIYRVDNAHGFVHTNRYYKKKGEVIRKMKINAPLEEFVPKTIQKIKKNWKGYKIDYLLG